MHRSQNKWLHLSRQSGTRSRQILQSPETRGKHRLGHWWVRETLYRKWRKELTLIVCSLLSLLGLWSLALVLVLGTNCWKQENIKILLTTRIQKKWNSIWILHLASRSSSLSSSITSWPPSLPPSWPTSWPTPWPTSSSSSSSSLSMKRFGLLAACLGLKAVLGPEAWLARTAIERKISEKFLTTRWCKN